MLISRSYRPVKRRSCWNPGNRRLPPNCDWKLSEDESRWLCRLHRCSLRNDAILGETPQRDQQLLRQRHYHDFRHTPFRSDHSRAKPHGQRTAQSGSAPPHGAQRHAQGGEARHPYAENSKKPPGMRIISSNSSRSFEMQLPWQTSRGWHLQLKCDKELADLSTMFDPILKGWHQYDLPLI